MKLRLIIQSGSLTGQEFQLETGSLLLGRGTDCSLRFDPNKDAGVSTRHAVISLESDGFYITDQRSTNGTFINGSRVERALLQAGSLIQLGYQGPSLQVIIEQDNSKILPTLVQQPPILNPTVVDSPQNFFSPLAANNPVFSPTNQNRMPPNNTPLANPGFSVPINPPINPPNPQMNFPVNPNPSMNSPVYGQYGQNPASPLANGTALLKQSFSNIGVYNPEKEKNSTKTISIIASLGVMAVLMLVVGVIMLSSIGLAGSIVGTILAFTPAPFYLLLFLWLDRYDPEPAWALGGAFAWGALVAVIISFFVNTIFGAVIGGSLGDILGTVVSAPVIEEATKGLGVLLVSIFLRKEFDDILDGIVYAGVVALGFATVENVLYYGREFASAGVGPGLVVILFLRGVLSPFAHALFTSMTGIGCGIARETHNKTLKIVMPLAGYIGAVILHALWNGIAVAASIMLGFIGYFIVYLVVWVPLFLIMLGVMFYMASREAKLIKEMLAIEVARGLISPEELELIGSSLARLKWLSTTAFSGNWKKFTAQRQFLRSVTKLAFCYWHVARASKAGGQTQSLPQIPKFQLEVKALKAEI